MSSEELKRAPQRTTQWCQGSSYAVAVDVEVIFPPDDPAVPCLKPETIRFLEHLSESAAAGDVETLRKAGTVFRRIE